MPEFVLMPAPVTTTTLRDFSRASAMSCSSSVESGDTCCVGIAPVRGRPERDGFCLSLFLSRPRRRLKAQRVYGGARSLRPVEEVGLPRRRGRKRTTWTSGWVGRFWAQFVGHLLYGKRTGSSSPGSPCFGVSSSRGRRRGLRRRQYKGLVAWRALRARRLTYCLDARCSFVCAPYCSSLQRDCRCSTPSPVSAARRVARGWGGQWR